VARRRKGWHELPPDAITLGLAAASRHERPRRYLVALTAQETGLSELRIATSIGQDLGIAAAFTLVSLLRSYVLRRLFESLGSGRGRGSRLKPGRIYRLEAG
jgi:hypothetical protein